MISPTETVRVRCPVCQGEAEAFSPYRGIDRDNPLLVEIFANKQVWRCRGCHHGFCHPPAEFDLLKRYYETEYWEERTAAVRRGVALVKRLLPGFVGRKLQSLRLDQRNAARLNLILLHIEKQGGESYLKYQRLLEVGAGTANITTALLQRYSFNAQVVEPSDRFRYLYRWYGIQKVANTFEEMPESQPYVMILASHWLEHVVDLKETFDKLTRLLALNGAIFFEVPNCDDEYWQYRFFPNPVHLHFFTTSSLQKLLERHGLRVNSLMTCGPPVAWEKYIGYLKPETPALVSREDLKILEQERQRKEVLFLQSLDAETRAAWPSFHSTYSNWGRQYIQVVASRAL